MATAKLAVGTSLPSLSLLCSLETGSVGIGRDRTPYIRNSQTRLPSAALLLLSPETQSNTLAAASPRWREMNIFALDTPTARCTTHSRRRRLIRRRIDSSRLFGAGTATPYCVFRRLPRPSTKYRPARPRFTLPESDYVSPHIPSGIWHTMDYSVHILTSRLPGMYCTSCVAGAVSLLSLSAPIRQISHVHAYYLAVPKSPSKYFSKALLSSSPCSYCITNNLNCAPITIG
jgi:hypothetical protein